MADADLLRFLHKVEQLQQLVQSLESFPERRHELSACSNHNQVVSLAKKWGFEIGRRWGEPDLVTKSSVRENLLSCSFPPSGEERRYLIQRALNWRLELIVSCALSNDENFWNQQPEDEWILLLRGSASMMLKSPDEVIDLSVGSHLHLIPNRPHRLLRTDSAPGTAWLALTWL